MRPLYQRLRHTAGEPPLLHEPHVELDHVRGEERHEGEGSLVRADIVERDSTPSLAQPTNGAKHLGRSGSQRSLRELHHHAQVAQAPLGLIAEAVAAAKGRGLHVEEEKVRRPQPGLEGALERSFATGLVELGHELGALGLVEEGGGRLEG